MQSETVVKCDVKAAVPVKFGTSNNLLSAGCKIINLTFPNQKSCTVQKIQLTNKYTGLISILGKFKQTKETDGESFKFSWKRLVCNYKLMPHAHFANGAEETVLFNSSDFLLKAVDVCGLRFILCQPSVQFADFTVEQIKVYGAAGDERSSLQSLPSWLVNADTKTVVVPPTTERIATVLQDMWTLGKKAEQVCNIPEDRKPRRFDKDGCYEINLLTYN